jgi:hypothetical protein
MRVHPQNDFTVCMIVPRVMVTVTQITFKHQHGSDSNVASSMHVCFTFPLSTKVTKVQTSNVTALKVLCLQQMTCNCQPKLLSKVLRLPKEELYTYKWFTYRAPWYGHIS